MSTTALPLAIASSSSSLADHPATGALSNDSAQFWRPDPKAERRRASPAQIVLELLRPSPVHALLLGNAGAAQIDVYLSCSGPRVANSHVGGAPQRAGAAAFGEAALVRTCVVSAVVVGRSYSHDGRTIIRDVQANNNATLRKHCVANAARRAEQDVVLARRRRPVRSRTQQLGRAARRGLDAQLGRLQHRRAGAARGAGRGAVLHARGERDARSETRDRQHIYICSMK